MSVQYHISPSGHNLRCKICGNYYLFGNIRVCQVCGIILCKKHFHSGFCEQHYEGLPDGDKKKVQEYLQNIAKGNKISGLLFLAWILALVIPFLIMFLARPSDVTSSTWLMIPFLVVTFILICDALVFRIQKDDNEAEIQRIAKRQEKRLKDLATGAPEILQVQRDLSCLNCGSFNLSSARFCNMCGKELEIKKSVPS